MPDPQPMNVYPAPDGCKSSTPAPEDPLATQTEPSAVSMGGASLGTLPSPAPSADSN
jgi:hypothetical protein